MSCRVGLRTGSIGPFDYHDNTFVMEVTQNVSDEQPNADVEFVLQLVYDSDDFATASVNEVD